MTKSQKQTIINKVNWIHKAKQETKQLLSEKLAIEEKISESITKSLSLREGLNSEMKTNAELNIKIGGDYYTLVKNSIGGVDINQFHIQVTDNKL
jgi:hypothetical protein